MFELFMFKISAEFHSFRPPLRPVSQADSRTSDPVRKFERQRVSLVISGAEFPAETVLPPFQLRTRCQLSRTGTGHRMCYPEIKM
jgi:hypothetical protein